MKMLAKWGRLWDKLKRPINSLIYQHENVGKIGSFVGRLETSVKQRFLTNIQVLVKMSEIRDNIIISEIGLFYQHLNVG